MQQFKVRCSAIGKIMANGKVKGQLGQTAKTYCEEWVKEQLYQRRKEFTNKYTQKGCIVEDNSLDFIADQLGYGMLMKNEQYFINDFLNGTPDIILSDLIIDAKNSWDVFTFPLFDTEVPNKDYFWQLQGYMSLTGKSAAKLIYVLSDTPDNLIEREAYYWCKQNGYDELDLDIYEQFRSKMTYADIDAKMKIKVFDIARDNEAIEAINTRVLECREYITTLWNV